MSRALIVGIEPAPLVLISGFLQQRGFITRIAETASQAREGFKPPPDFLVCDLDLRDGEAIDILRLAAERGVRAVVLDSPGSASVDHPLIRQYRRITKPVTQQKVDALFANGHDVAETRSAHAGGATLVGKSLEMKRLHQTLLKIGHSDVTVLIIGESGTGKELVADALHAMSSRRRGPFLALNCGAVTPSLIESELFGHEKGSFTGAMRRHAGYFERAQGGTLFLDEVTEMPLELQVRLLRVLETRLVSRIGSADTTPIDVRVIAATNREPRDAVREGKLREDLLYRLQVVPIHVPPLRARTGDVRLLTAHFLAELNRDAGEDKFFTEAALATLDAYKWPGNVRELRNLVERVFILTEGRAIEEPTLQLEAPLPAAMEPPSIRFQVGDSLAEVEQRLIEQTLQTCRTKEEAARILGVSNKTLYNKLRRYRQEDHARMQSTPAAAVGPVAMR